MYAKCLQYLCTIIAQCRYGAVVYIVFGDIRFFSQNVTSPNWKIILCIKYYVLILNKIDGFMFAVYHLLHEQIYWTSKMGQQGLSGPSKVVVRPRMS